MARTPQPRGTKGSLKWIQHSVNDAPSVLDSAVVAAARGGIAGPVDWRSPKADDDLAEYSDGDFVRLLDMELEVRSLEDFWPTRGPQWDALGVSADGQILLVEAKAHVSEIISPGTGAGERSLARIRSAFAEVAEALGVTSSCDWTGTFYQYTNRLAHLYFLREVNRLPAWLVSVLFVGDTEMKGPATSAEWHSALEVVHGALGIRRHRLRRYMLEVYLDVRR